MPRPIPGLELEPHHLAALRDIHCILAKDTTILRLSPSVLQLTGHQPDALVGTPLYGLTHLDDASLLASEFGAAQTSPGVAFRFFARIRSAFSAPLFTIFELHGHFQSSNLTGDGVYILVARPAFLSCSMRLDSFLELKMEQERLLRQRAELLHDENCTSDDEDDNTEMNIEISVTVISIPY